MDHTEEIERLTGIIRAHEVILGMILPALSRGDPAFKELLLKALDISASEADPALSPVDIASLNRCRVIIRNALAEARLPKSIPVSDG